MDANYIADKIFKIFFDFLLRDSVSRTKSATNQITEDYTFTPMFALIFLVLSASVLDTLVRWLV